MDLRIVSRRMASCLAIAMLFSSCMRSPEARSAKYIESGKTFLAKNDPSRAILQFRNAVQATPRDAEAYYQLSLALFAAGDLASGVGSLRKALALNPKHRAAELRMAQLKSMASDSNYVKEARQSLKEMLEENPDDADALHALAFTDLKLGNSQVAIEELGRAMTLAPQDLVIAVLMAQAKLRENDPKGAEEVLKKAIQNLPKSAEAAVALGRFYEMQNRWPEAEQQFKRALGLDQNDAWSLENVAQLQDHLGRKSEAEQTYKRLSALPGRSHKPLHAMFLFQEGRRDEAIKEFESLAKADLEDREARTRLIAAYRAVQRTSDVETLLNAALKKNPKDSDALLQRSEMFLAVNRYDKAEADLSQVLHLNPDSASAHYMFAKLHQARGEQRTFRQELLNALQLDPRRLQIRLEAAQALITAGEAKAALNLLDEAPDTQKKLSAWLVQRNWALWGLGDLSGMRKGIDTGLLVEHSTDLLLQDGVWKLRAGKAAAARDSLEKALHINPGDVRALSALNQSYVAEKQNGTALQKVKEYAAREPKAAPVQEYLGMLLVASGDRTKAREAFAMARAADPRFVQADFSLIQLDVVEGKVTEARRRLEALLSADKANTTARLWLGNIEATQGNRKAALENFHEVVARDPGNAQGLNNYAYLLAESGGELTEALKYAQRAKELSPTHAAYGDTLGWVLYRRGLYPMAVSELERAAGNGGDAVCNYHLAMAYAKVGNLARGRQVLQAGLKQNPNLPEAKTAREMLGIAQ